MASSRVQTFGVKAASKRASSFRSRRPNLPLPAGCPRPLRLSWCFRLVLRSIDRDCDQRRCLRLRERERDFERERPREPEADRERERERLDSLGTSTGGCQVVPSWHIWKGSHRQCRSPSPCASAKAFQR
mmetsp:Transcript_31441/g.98637  ORF Transcript_31441/g.98637 Transcript_31441/m.98637 type:complete len:130 (-) Transcript_31441:749-1138(-)